MQWSTCRESTQHFADKCVDEILEAIDQRTNEFLSCIKVDLKSEESDEMKEELAATLTWSNRTSLTSTPDGHLSVFW